MKNKSDKTKTYSDSYKTTVYGDSEKLTKGTVHNLKAGDTVILKNTEYKIIEIISESTGEAVIYKINDSDLNVYIFKLYFEFYDSEKEPNTEALTRIKTITDADILKLYDFGTGINKYKGKYCFEISDFAYGHDLLRVENLKEKYSPDFIKKEVIPQIFKGILRLHENKIYHCDLKPQNVFYLDKEQKEIVIGDYGSAKTFEFDAEKKSRKTTTVKGTDFYLPPEQARGFISEKNDYYSFGMILLHLFYPEKILLNKDEPKSLSHSKLKQIIERQFEAKPIIDYNTEYERINKLIEGLTLVDFNLRWGEKEVKSWLEGKNVEVFYKTTISNSVASKYSERTLIFGKYKISSIYDLRDYIINEKNWYTDLIEDKDNREDFADWFLKLYQGDKSKRSAFNRIIKYYSQEGIDFISDAVIRFFIPEHPVIFGIRTFNFHDSKDLMKTTALAFSYLIFDLWDSSSENDIKLYLFRYEFALKQIKSREKEVISLVNILYKNMKIKVPASSDFFNYKIHAYTSVSKNSSSDLQQFLFDYLPTERSLSFINLNLTNELKYKADRTLTKYFFENKINKSLKENGPKEIISVEYSQNYGSHDDFCVKTVDIAINKICKKHSFPREIIESKSYEKFIKGFKDSYTDLTAKLKIESDNFKKNYARKLKYERKFIKELKDIESILKKGKYHEIDAVITQIPKIKKKAAQLLKKRQAQIEANKLTQKEKRKKLRKKTKRIVFLIIILSVISNFFEKGIELTNDYSYKNVTISGIEMIFVKGGVFQMGHEKGESNEKPIHKVILKDFYISKHEITNKQFCDFLNEYGSDRILRGKYRYKKMILSGKKNNPDWNSKYDLQIIKNGKVWELEERYENLPVNNVSWYGADEYCKYMKGSLPTEAEWEFAAKSGINTYDLGIKGMSDDFQEWCEDYYNKNYYKKSPEFDPCNKRWSKRRSIKGSPFSYDRYYQYPKTVKPKLGFRLCMSKI